MCIRLKKSSTYFYCPPLELSCQCPLFFSLLLEGSRTTLARHRIEVPTSYIHIFCQGGMGLKLICRKMISAHLGKFRNLESISTKIPYPNLAEILVVWKQIHRNTSLASNVTINRHILNHFVNLYGTIIC